MAAIIRFVTLALIATFLISEVELLIQADNALKGQLPYMASIAFRGKRSYCGGAIINSRYVISSGHMLFRLQTRDLIVYLGAWKYSDLDAVPASIAKAVIHPEFNVRRRLNDIALVRMANEIKFTNLVQPIALPDMDFSDVHGETFLVSGFGLTEKPRDAEQSLQRSSILQYYRPTSLTLLECIQKFEDVRDIITDREKEFNEDIICTENPAGKAICFGDLGDPLISNGTLVGIASWGCACHSEVPGVYTKIHSHIEWITKEMKT